MYTNDIIIYFVIGIIAGITGLIIIIVALLWLWEIKEYIKKTASYAKQTADSIMFINQKFFKREGSEEQKTFQNGLTDVLRSLREE